MLSILYILHHCTMFQRLGGNFPRYALARQALPLPAERRHAEQDALLCSRTLTLHHCFFPLLPCPQSSRSCGWDQHRDPSTRVKSLGSFLKPGPPSQAEPSSGRSVLGGSLCKQNLAKVPVQIKRGQDFISTALVPHAAVDLSGEKTTEAFCFTARREGQKETRAKQLLKKKKIVSRVTVT